MKKESNAHTKDRMIHIRLDDKTHKRLKIKAVQEDTSIQKLVEDLILKSFLKSPMKDVR
jgi:predicted HicB family RNase H-like nuclease